MTNANGKRVICTIFISLLSLFLFAQDPATTSTNGMESLMRSNDKIYVVMAVCLTILVVLFLYLIRIDIKVSKKEKTL